MVHPLDILLRPVRENRNDTPIRSRAGRPIDARRFFFLALSFVIASPTLEERPRTWTPGPLGRVWVELKARQPGASGGGTGSDRRNAGMCFAPQKKGGGASDRRPLMMRAARSVRFF